MVLLLLVVFVGSWYVLVMVFSFLVKVVVIEFGWMMYDDGSGFKFFVIQFDVIVSYVLWIGVNFVVGGSIVFIGLGFVWYSVDGKVWMKFNYVGIGLISFV